MWNFYSINCYTDRPRINDIFNMEIPQIASTEAFSILEHNQESFLIDVRTNEEWKEVGVPDVDDSRILFLSWRLKPDMSINPEFSDLLLSNIKSKDMKLIFLCRGGSRSNEASQIAYEHGFHNCYNIIDGFEGGANGAGWKNSNLPYKLV